MLALYLQTLLLLAVAYFLGAGLACLVRRSLFAPQPQPVSSERHVDPLPEYANREPVTARAPAPERAPAAVPVAAAASAPVGPPQDLKRIRLIDAGLESALNRLGVTRYEQIAAWMHADVQRIGEGLGTARRISTENWIEQAQVLAKGGDTYYSRRRDRGEAASAQPTPDEGDPRPIAKAPAPAPAAEPAPPRDTVRPQPKTPGSSGVVAEIVTGVMPAVAVATPAAPDVADRAAFATRPATPSAAPPEAAAAPAAAVPIRPAPAANRDSLQRIGHIDADTEKALNTEGIFRYLQIAHWSPAEVERFDKQLSADGRIARENWIEQAQILSRGGDTAFSRQHDRSVREEALAAPLRPARLADAIRDNAAKTPAVEETRRTSRSDLGALRSVRSQAFQSPDAAEGGQRVSVTRSVRSAALDDLKRIRGIGVLIEKKLNSMGVVAYEAIANWSAADIDRISQSLDFKGRIERENWVEQARILASGGATEFSRRVDKGEVETSRAKT